MCFKTIKTLHEYFKQLDPDPKKKNADQHSKLHSPELNIPRRLSVFIKKLHRIAFCAGQQTKRQALSNLPVLTGHVDLETIAIVRHGAACLPIISLISLDM